MHRQACTSKLRTVMHTPASHDPSVWSVTAVLQARPELGSQPSSGLHVKHVLHSVHWAWSSQYSTTASGSLLPIRVHCPGVLPISHVAPTDLPSHSGWWCDTCGNTRVP